MCWGNAGLWRPIKTYTRNPVVGTQKVGLRSISNEESTLFFTELRALLSQTMVKMSKEKNYLIAEVDITRVPRMRW